MDESPMAQLIRHADAVAATRLAVAQAAHQLAADAEATRPGQHPPQPPPPAPYGQ